MGHVQHVPCRAARMPVRFSHGHSRLGLTRLAQVAVPPLPLPGRDAGGLHERVRVAGSLTRAVQLPSCPLQRMLRVLQLIEMRGRVRFMSLLQMHIQHLLTSHA